MLAMPASASTPPGVPHDGEPWRSPDFASWKATSACAFPGRPRRPAGPSVSSAGWSFPSRGASAALPRGGPSRARWRWPASSSGRRASRDGCGPSPRGRIPRQRSWAAFPSADPSEPSPRSSSPTWRTPPPVNVWALSHRGKRGLRRSRGRGSDAEQASRDLPLGGAFQAPVMGRTTPPIVGSSRCTGWRRRVDPRRRTPSHRRAPATDPSPDGATPPGGTDS